MSAAARALATQQEQRRRRILLGPLLVAPKESERVERPRERPQEQPTRATEDCSDGQKKGQDQAQVHGEGSSPCPPKPLSLSQQRSLATLRWLHPTAMHLADHGRGRAGSSANGAPAGLWRRWHKPLPWGHQNTAAAAPAAAEGQLSGSEWLSTHSADHGVNALVTIRERSTASSDPHPAAQDYADRRPGACGAGAADAQVCPGPAGPPPQHGCEPHDLPSTAGHSATQDTRCIRGKAPRPTGLPNPAGNRPTDPPRARPCGRPDCCTCAGAPAGSDSRTEAGAASAARVQDPGQGIRPGRHQLQGYSEEASFVELDVMASALTSAERRLGAGSSGLSASEAAWWGRARARVFREVTEELRILQERVVPQASRGSNSLDVLPKELLERGLQLVSLAQDAALPKKACRVEMFLRGRSKLAAIFRDSLRGKVLAEGLMDALDEELAMAPGGSGAREHGDGVRRRGIAGVLDAMPKACSDRWFEVLTASDRDGGAAELVARRALGGLLLRQLSQRECYAEPLACAAMCTCFKVIQDTVGAVASPLYLYAAVVMGPLPSQEQLASPGATHGSPMPERYSCESLFNTVARVGQGISRPGHASELAAVMSWALLAENLHRQEDRESRAQDVVAVELFGILRRHLAEGLRAAPGRLAGEDELAAEQLFQEWALFGGADEADERLGSSQQREQQQTAGSSRGGAPVLPPPPPPPPATSWMSDGGADKDLITAMDLVEQLLEVAALPYTGALDDGHGPDGVPDQGRAGLHQHPVTLPLRLDSPEHGMALMVCLYWSFTRAHGPNFQPELVRKRPSMRHAGHHGAQEEAEEQLELSLCHVPSQPSSRSPGYDWPLIHRSILVVTPTSNQVDQAKKLRELLVKKRVKFLWVQGKGVDGVSKMLMALTQVRREMMEAGRDLWISVVDIKDFGDKDDRDEGAKAGTKGRGDAGVQHGVADQPVGGDPPPPPSRPCGLKAVLERLEGHMERALKRRNSEGESCDGEPSRDLVAAMEEACRLLGLLMQSEYPAREGALIEVIVVECLPSRPWEMVLPDVPQQQQLQLQVQKEPRPPSKRQEARLLKRAFFGKT